ncbi:MAG TPA: TIGR01244 family sulfur transferase [Caulobacteraceae bacterium]
MGRFRKVTDRFSVSPQIGIDDVAAAAAEGFTAIINNRPDGEEAGQPTAAEIGDAAGAARLAYQHIPIVGRPTSDQAAAVREAARQGKTLAFCRSGTRSIMAWSLGALEARDAARDELVRQGASAGYDLEPILPIA